MSRNKRSSFLYEFLHFLVWIGGQVFYREYHIQDLENMPDDEHPTILVSNHQNGMMDPVMLCVNNPRPLNFLTRADIFQKPLTNKILRHLNMLPVYRPHDKKTNMREMNERTFDECTQRILDGRVISLFPEGNHNNRKSLRALKGGVLKVTASAWSRAENDQDVVIVPVGVDYSHFEKFRSNLLIRYGKPISAKEVFKGNKEPGKAELNQLREVIKASLSAEMIDIRNADIYDELIISRNLIEEVILMDPNESNINIRYEAYKKGTVLIEEKLQENLEEVPLLKSTVSDYFSLLVKNKTSEESRAISVRNSHKWSKNKVLSKLLYPIYLLGFILNIIPFSFTERFVKKNIKDPHFISSIRLAIGTFSFLIYYILVFLVVSIVWGIQWGFLSLGIIILMGFLALKISDFLRDYKMGSTYFILENETKAKIDKKRDKLLSLIFELTH